MTSEGAFNMAEGGAKTLDVFLVHTSGDRYSAIQIKTELARRGLKIYAHHVEDSAFGRRKPTVNSIIMGAVSLSKIVSFLLTENAIKSQWVKNEILLALERSRREGSMCCRLCMIGIPEEERSQYRTGELVHIPSVIVDFNRENWADRLFASIKGFQNSAQEVIRDKVIEEMQSLSDKESESSLIGTRQLPLSLGQSKYSLHEPSQDESCLPAPDSKSSASSSTTKYTEYVPPESEHNGATLDPANVTSTAYIKSTNEHSRSSELEQNELLLFLAASNPKNMASTSRTENTNSVLNKGESAKGLLCLPAADTSDVFSKSMPENSAGNTAQNESGRNKRVLLCLPEPAPKRSECTSKSEGTDGVTVVYKRVQRSADAASAKHTQSAGQKNRIYSLVNDGNQAEKTEEEDNQEPNIDQLQTVGTYTPKTIKMQDDFSTFIQRKVKAIQANVKGVRARNLQKAVEESVKYYLNEVEKLEPLFRVSELLQVGSYAEGTKLFETDEFDFLAVIDSLSREGTVVLEPQQNVTGSVTLSLAKDYLNSSLRKLCGKNGKLGCFDEPRSEKPFAGPAKFGKVFVQAVRNSIKAKGFRCFGSPRDFLFLTPSGIEFTSRGLVMPPVDQIALVLKSVEVNTPNIFLRFELEDLEITVDLSPAIRYHKLEDCIDSEKLTCPKLMNAVLKHGSCLLIGKKTGGFRVTITECEVMYMQKILKTKHKLLYIFLKYVSYVFKTTFQPFTSYMLKNICIHHDHKCQSESETLKTCFENVIQDITAYCAVQKLPSVVNKDVDLSRGSRPDFDAQWHLRRHFLMVLKTFHNFSGDIISSEMLETILKDTIIQSVNTFNIYDTSEHEQLSCKVCEMNVTGKLQTTESIRKGGGYFDSDLLK